MENEGLDLDIIVNPKVTEDGESVVQVERSYVWFPNFPIIAN